METRYALTLYVILGLGWLGSLYWALARPDTFGTVFAVEDGPIEYATAVLLAVAAILMLRRAGHIAGRLPRALGYLYSLAFFWAAGEEISWGQRIFDWESGAFFVENNFQGETNLHNLVVGDTHLTEVVFGTGLSLVIIAYLVGLPFLYLKSARIRALADRFAVPVPARRMAGIALVATAFATWIDLPRQWEVYEFSFSVIMCLIFLQPANGHVFGTAPSSGRDHGTLATSR